MSSSDDKKEIIFSMTPHFIKVLCRTLEMNVMDLIRKAKKIEVRKLDYTAELRNYFNGNKGELYTICYPIHHSKRCSEYSDEDKVESFCEDCKKNSGFLLKSCMYLTYMNPAKCLVNIFDIKSEVLGNKNESESVFDLLSQIQKLEGKIYSFCPCGEVQIKDGRCKNCYIHEYTRTEEEGGNCAICLENGGRWIKLSCNHIFHMKCFHKFGNKNMSFV